jgi:hypothetical protein
MEFWSQSSARRRKEILNLKSTGWGFGRGQLKDTHLLYQNHSTADVGPTLSNVHKLQQVGVVSAPCPCLFHFLF